MKNKKISIITEEQQLKADKKIKQDFDSINVQLSNSTIPLMPELEEFVKKNPNRLIGCGG